MSKDAWNRAHNSASTTNFLSHGAQILTAAKTYVKFCHQMLLLRIFWFSATLGNGFGHKLVKFGDILFPHCSDNLFPHLVKISAFQLYVHCTLYRIVNKFCDIFGEKSGAFSGDWQMVLLIQHPLILQLMQSAASNCSNWDNSSCGLNFWVHCFMSWVLLSCLLQLIKGWIEFVDLGPKILLKQWWGKWSMSRELGWGGTHWGGNGCFLTISLYFGFNQISVWKKDKNGEKPKGLNHRNGKSSP